MSTEPEKARGTVKFVTGPMYAWLCLIEHQVHCVAL